MHSTLTYDDLVHDLASGVKEPSLWRIGVEHEALLFDRATGKRLDYETGIAPLFRLLQAKGWSPLKEKSQVIALNKGDAHITLEPGGQIELSGAPLRDLHEVRDELLHYFGDLLPALEQLNACLLPMGLDPITPFDQRPWMPKGRYGIMRAYMPKVGRHGLDMMTATCTIQVNLDFSSEEDMLKKLRVSLALQPIATALFAASPYINGEQTTYSSYRGHIWEHTDPDRCGALPFAFNEEMGFSRYVDYLRSVPMYFVYRDGQYHDVTGDSFDDFMQGKLPRLPGEYATMKDWQDQQTIVFPHTRLKHYVELRAADMGPPSHILALPALWVGLLYDEINLNDLAQMIAGWAPDAISASYEEAAHLGLNSFLMGKPTIACAKELVDRARAGLQRRALGEEKYLKPLDGILATGKTVADHLRLEFPQIKDQWPAFLNVFAMKPEDLEITLG